MRNVCKAQGLGVGVTLAGAIAAAGALAQTAPTSAVEIMVGANPGGGFDRMARSLETILIDGNMLDVPLNITYHPGGGGAVAWATLNRFPGDMSKLSIFSPNIVTNEVLEATDGSYRDNTMLATLVFEDGCFAVNPNGAITNADELVAALENDASNLRFGFAVAAGNQWHIAMAKLAEATGADITQVRATVFDSGGRSTAALLGESTDVTVTGCAGLAQYHESGDLHIVAVSAPERLSGSLAEVPTWRELGHDVVWGAWRGVLGPRDLSADQIAFWEGIFEQVIQTESWAEIVQENFWRTSFLGSEDTADMMAYELEQYTDVLRTLGLID